MRKEKNFMLTVSRKLRKSKILNILFVVFVILSSMQYTYTKAAVNESVVSYHIKTKRYERRPDRTVKIEFASIEGINKNSAKNINYVLEKEAFLMAANFIDEDLIEKEGSLLVAIDKIDLQDIYVYYEILYQDKNLLNIQCLGETIYYKNKDSKSIILSSEHGRYLVFDIKTGKRLKLSDFITIDRRIINYKADDYQEPDYDSPARPIFYSFKDAFRVYDKKKYQFHDEMSIKEALEQLKSGEIEWGIKKDKALSLRAYYQSLAWITIPYAYIKDFAKY